MSAGTGRRHDRGNDKPPSKGKTCVSCHPKVHEAAFGRVSNLLLRLEQADELDRVVTAFLARHPDHLLAATARGCGA